MYLKAARAFTQYALAPVSLLNELADCVPISPASCLLPSAPAVVQRPKAALHPIVSFLCFGNLSSHFLRHRGRFTQPEPELFPRVFCKTYSRTERPRLMAQLRRKRLSAPLARPCNLPIAVGSIASTGTEWARPILADKRGLVQKLFSALSTGDFCFPHDHIMGAK